MNFEQSIKELEEIVQKLEQGDLSLEKALEYFQKGIGLSKFCTEKLDDAEQKVNILVKKMNGDITEEPLELKG